MIQVGIIKQKGEPSDTAIQERFMLVFELQHDTLTKLKK